MSKKQAESSPVALTDETVAVHMSAASLDVISGDMERRLQVMDRILSVIAKHVEPEVDIVMIDGEPAKTGNLADKLYRVVGGRFEFVKDNEGHPIVKRLDYKDDAGEYYLYEAYGCYTPPWEPAQPFEASGSFSSRHKFFGKDSEGFKPKEKVDEMNVRQAALTECKKKAIFGGLGIGRLTAERCKAVGIDLARASGYSFRKGSKGGATDTTADGDVRAQIEAICRKLAGSGFGAADGFACETAEQVLKTISEGDYESDGKPKHFDGYTRFDKITVRSLKHVLKKANDAFNKHDPIPID